jgi:hypothetical protein
MPTRNSQLRRGLGDPQILIVVVALAILAAGLLGLNWLVVSGHATAIPESVLLRDPRDDGLRVSYEIGRLKINPPRKPAVYILGGSAARECFLGEGSLANEIGMAGGGDVEVHQLASNNREFGSDLAVIDNLPRTPGVIVIEVGMARFVHVEGATEDQLAGKPLLLWSPALKDFLVDQTGHGRFAFTILPGVADYAVTYAKWRLHRLLIARPFLIRFKQHLYTRDMAYDTARKRELVRLWLENRGRPGGQWERVFPYDAALLERCVALARERGFEVVLLEGPLNTDIVGHQWDAGIERYRGLCDALARTYGARYIDFLAQAGLRDQDFRDLTHMLYPGQVKYERELAAALAPFTAQLASAPDR